MIKKNNTDITYSSFNKAIELSDGVNTTKFFYAPNRTRYKKILNGDTTYYIGKQFEQEKVGTTIRYKNYIYAGGEVVAINIEEDDGSMLTPSVRYLHKDSLGSVDTITDESGVVIQRLTYKPFGERVVTSWKDETTGLLPLTKRGYTGHEHIKEHGLINMNARLYDPTIGRFLSADTMIPSPYDTQSYTRYSYVKNNPMVYTDPTGHWFLSRIIKKIKKVVTVVVVAAIAVYTGGLALGAFGFTASAATAAGFSSAMAMATASGAIGAIIASGAVAGFAAGVAGGLLNGGSLKQSMRAGLKGALWGAVSAGVANGIGTAFSGTSTGAAAAKAIAHGLTRAAISRVQGGKYSEGFWSGFASSALGGIIGKAKTLEGQTAMAAIVGGTASQLGGGKFANGAVSAAFVHMYNRMGHKIAEQVGGKAAEETAKALNVNKSMSNIIKSGGQGIVGGAIAGFAFAGPIGAVAGGILGLAGGLIKGAAMEAFGVNDAIENTTNMIVNYTKEQVEATGTLSIEYKAKE